MSMAFRKPGVTTRRQSADPASFVKNVISFDRAVKDDPSVGQQRQGL